MREGFLDHHADDLDLLQYWQALMRRRALIAGITLAAGLLAFLVSRFWLQPTYVSTAVILIRETNSQMSILPAGAGALLSTLGGQPTSGTRVQAMALLKARRLAEMVKRDLGLPEEEFAIGDERMPVTERSARLRVDSGREGQIEITVTAHKASLAAEIANAYVKALQEYQETDEISSARSHLRFVEGQLERTRRELAEAEEALKSFQERQKVVAMDATADQAQRRLWELDSELATTRVALGESRRRLSALRSRLVRRAQSEGAPAIANAQEVERLRGKLADLESTLVVEQRAYRDDHPRIQELKASSEAVRLELRKYMEQAVEAAYEGVLPELIDLEVAVIAGETREAALTRERARIQSQVDQLPASVLRFARLSREVKEKSALYEMLSQECHRARIAASKSSVPVVLLDAAETPKAPSSPKHKRNTLLGLILGLMAGVSLAVILDWMQAIRDATRRLPGHERDRVADTEPSDLEPARRR